MPVGDVVGSYRSGIHRGASTPFPVSFSASLVGLPELVNASAKSEAPSETLSTFAAYIVNGRGHKPRRFTTRRRVDREADIVVGGLQGDRS